MEQAMTQDQGDRVHLDDRADGGGIDGAKLTEKEIWFGYRGRITVGQYWSRTILMAIAASVIAFYVSPAGASYDLALSVSVLWPASALAWKRLQDQDKNGALFLLILIPALGQLVWLVLSFLVAPGPNRFGPRSSYKYTTPPNHPRAS